VTFPREVYALVGRVPPGRVITYGTIARLLGDPRKAREVGWAMAATPHANPPIPAHRVIKAHGELSGSAGFGGYEGQRARLEAEGVVFEPDGRIDLDRYLWLPPLDVEERSAKRSARRGVS
jgi:methylated-DNA-protein-cysteine methyltransferase related protein